MSRYVKSVIELMHNSISRSHFYFKSHGPSIRIVLPGPKIITSSHYDRNRLSLCWQKDTVATNVFFAMFSLAEPYPIQSEDQMRRLHAVSGLHIKAQAARRSLDESELCLYLWNSSMSRHASKICTL